MPRDARAPDPRRALGQRGENLVARWYETGGYEILDRNWRCREGELDLILGRGRTVVFCEVKTRTSNRFGAPVEAITRVKQQRIRTLAARWLAARRLGGRDLRFDVASVMVERGTDPVVEVIEGAF
ncbi:MAG TPA: YraN family protein [Acidimicrobiia bacterium]